MRSGLIRRKAAETRKVKSLVEHKHRRRQRNERKHQDLAARPLESIPKCVTDECERRYIHIEKLPTEGRLEAEPTEIGSSFQHCLELRFHQPSLVSLVSLASCYYHNKVF